MKTIISVAMIVIFSFAIVLNGLADEELTEADRDALLSLLSAAEEESRSYIVLPDDFLMPATGLDGEFRLLLIGVDTDRTDLKGRSDTMILAVFNTKQETLKLISFMRDLYVKIPGRGYNKLNAAYSFGGPDLLERTLNENFSIAVDGYLAVNFSLMANLVDAIGGVELQVDEYEVKPLNGILGYFNYQKGIPESSGELASSGTQILTGLQAMSYSRIRKTDSDFERVERQQKMIKAIYTQLRQATIAQLMDAVSAFISQVGTDISMSNILSLVNDMMGVNDFSTMTLTVPVKGAFSSKLIQKTFFLVPNLKRNIFAINNFLATQPEVQTVD